MRLERISNSTRTVIDYLQQQPLVEELIFPLDPSFAQFELAKEQMSGACGLVTFVMRAERVDQIEAFCERLKHILIAISWGGHESLIVPRCASLAPELFDATNREHRMLRLYVGLEEPAYIIQDLEQAFGGQQ